MKQKTTLPPITPKQREILLLLYRYRFLKRSQIQILLHHNHFNRIILWLNDLTIKKYIRRYYQPTFAPGMSFYSLGTVGRKYFKKHTTHGIKITLLDRVWREEKLSPQFKNHCMLLANIYLSLLTLTEKTKATLKFYTKTDLYGMKHLISPSPDAYFSITETTGSTKRYFLDIIDPYVLPKERKQRVMQYFRYYQKEVWQKHNTNQFPEIIFICPDEWAKHSLAKFIMKMLKSETNLYFSLTTWQKIQEEGLSKNVLQKIKQKEINNYY